ncbi:MAG TPA: UvrD-helicase domain-containing protein [Myxococcaceae bacterium]
MVRASSVVVDGSGLRLGSEHWGWPALDQVHHRGLLVAGTIKLSFRDGRTVSAWGSPREARALRNAIEMGRAVWAKSMEADVHAGLRLVRDLLGLDRYLSRRLIAEFRERHASLFDGALAAARLLAVHGDADAAALVELLSDVAGTVDRRNATWGVREQEQWRELFDTVERLPLTSEQRKAVVDFEDRNLLIAAAGSGKSSTLVAKIAYAVRKGLFQPEEVLALAFNKKAAEELTERIQDRLKQWRGVGAIRAETFHGLAYRILSERQKPTVEDERDLRIKETYEHLRERNADFRRDVARFIVEHTPDLRDRTEFSTYEEYLEYVKATEDRGGAQGRHLLTLAGHHVASDEERKIANWLFVHGVPYEYEKTYPHVEATRERRNYTPDFYYPEIDAWHEHFGVDAQGHPAPCIGDPEEYLNGMQWKREQHRRSDTGLLETTSAQFSSGILYAKLEELLREHGQKFRELSTAEIDARLSGDQHRDFAQLIASFIAHWKNRQVPVETLMELGSLRDRAFLSICKRVLDEYQVRLEHDRRIDFDDLILGATASVRSGAWRSPFRLILVDEFQDISASRADLLRALLGQHRDAVLFCVGDDWQAINGFAGSELAILRNFEREFGFHAVNYLTRTFRSNQGISSAAQAFVERNPAQYRKNVVAHDQARDGCIRIVRYASPAKLLGAYQAIAREVASAGHCTVRILGRYRRNEQARHLALFRRLAPNARVQFNTMHGSKGLEADYVVLDRLESGGAFAFPSTITDDSVLHLVMPEKEPFPHAEERRLMYVALTRARHRVFVLAPEERPSPFVGELAGTSAHPSAAPLEACPYCKNGTRVRRKGRYGTFWSCSRYPICAGKPWWRQSRRRSRR